MSLRKRKISLVDNIDHNNVIFELIAKDIEEQGYSIRPGALPDMIVEDLFQHQMSMDEFKYTAAGIGRGDDFIHNDFVRTDEICWIDDNIPAGKKWLDWTTQLRTYLNRRLFLGLFSFESHFAHYAPGSYYKRHSDAFKGEANRILSIVAYLNPNWLPTDGGELILYNNEEENVGIKVIPLYGTIVTFLSEDFPHEVLQTNRDRYSVAGWFRVNSSTPDRIDPPS